MFLRPRAVCTLAALSALIPFGTLHADTLQPHRGVYDLALKTAEPSTSLVAASGRLVFQISGSDCKGYGIEYRNVTSVTDREGTRRVTDVRSSTFETFDPAVLAFQHETLVDDAPTSAIKGEAHGRSDGVTVTVSEPKETEVHLPRAIFPTAHTRLILEAAEAGERIIEAVIYDGADEADKTYDTATVIGPPQTGLPGASPNEVAVLSAIPDVKSRTAWRLVISYFEAGAAEGERMPAYELTFSLLDNGVGYDVSFNYGAFVLAGELTELELVDATPCEE